MADPEPQTHHEVLIVEDNEHTAYMLQFILERFGYRVRLAADGRAARNALDDAPPDAVVLDLMLPYVSGEDVLAAMRDLPEWRYVPRA